MQSAPLSRRVLWLASLVVLAVYALLRVHLIEIPLGRDEGGYAYAGQQILAGGVMYRDAFDLRPPGPFYLYALALRFVAPTAAGIHLFLHAYNLATLATLCWLAHALTRSRAAALWSALVYAVLSSLPGVQGFQASSEQLMLLPLVLCTRGALAPGRQARAALFAAGVCGSLACWIKQSAFVSLAFLPVWIAFDARRAGRGIVLDLLAFAGGGVAVTLAILAAFARAGVLGELLYWSFEHPFLYASSGLMLARVTAQLAELLTGSPVASGFAALGLVVSAREAPRQASFLLPLFALSLLATLPGKAYEHYFCQLLPALALAAGIGLDWTFARIVSGRARAVVAALAALGIAALPVAIAPGYYATQTPDQVARAEFGLNPFVESPEIADYLRAHSQEGDRVLIVGSEPQILFLAGRRSATPFIYFYPVFENYPRHAEFQQRIWEEIEARRPEWIVHVDVETSLSWDGRAQRVLLDQLRELLASEYEAQAVALIQAPRGHLVPLTGPQLPFLRSAIAKAPGRVFLYRLRAGA